jgi:transposase-like protein
VLVELSVVEQRYDAVLAVQRDGRSVTEVALAYGVSRQSVHAWLRRYEVGGLPALADRSHKPRTSPNQIDAAIEARVCELHAGGALRGRLGNRPAGARLGVADR